MSDVVMSARMNIRSDGSDVGILGFIDFWISLIG